MKNKKPKLTPNPIFIKDDGNLPISTEGSLFIGWMELKLKECIEKEDFEEAEKLKRDIENAKKNTSTF